jgi:hypothetical protein
VWVSVRPFHPFFVHILTGSGCTHLAYCRGLFSRSRSYGLPRTWGRCLGAYCDTYIISAVR